MMILDWESSFGAEMPVRLKLSARVTLKKVTR
jgi:hypothetical protein